MWMEKRKPNAAFEIKCNQASFVELFIGFEVLSMHD